MMANSLGSKNKRKASIASVASGSNKAPKKRMKMTIHERIATTSTHNEINYQEQILEKLEEELKCNICTEVLIKPTVLNCSHMFCEYCIVKWKKQQERCPICRDTIESQIRVLALDVYIEKVIELLSPEQSKDRKKVINQRERSSCAKPRRSPRLKNRTCVTVTSSEESLEESFHLRALIDEVLHLANHLTYD